MVTAQASVVKPAASLLCDEMPRCKSRHSFWMCGLLGSAASKSYFIHTESYVIHTGLQPGVSLLALIGNRFNGFTAQTVKTVRRSFANLLSGLKPGENKMSDFKAVLG